MESTTTARTKEQIYDAIGECNRVIVTCEHNIPQMEDHLQTKVNEPDNEMAIRQALHEHRQLLDEKKAEVKRLRQTLISRLEIELEKLTRTRQTEESLTVRELSNLDMDIHTLDKELQTLRKLV